MKDIYCGKCKNWAEDLELNDGTGICSIRKTHECLTNIDFSCDEYKYNWMLFLQMLSNKIKLFFKKKK
jgi:hypothetical protein